MPKITQIKTTFTAGEVSPDLLGRGDLNAYDNGALKLRNVFIQPTGGVIRRAGLRYIAAADGAGRLMAFEFNTDQTYLLVFTHQKISIYANGILETTLTAPWTEQDIPQIVWTQSADTLLLTHPDNAPKKLVRTGAGVWAIQNWDFYADANRIFQPMYKFAESHVTLTPSNTTGIITVTASVAVFDTGHTGTRLRIGNKDILIQSVSSPTVITAEVKENLLNTNPTLDWEEQAFSPVRGYPVTTAFHQDRLVIGGSRDLPNRMWFSQSGDVFNFDLGTGLDSEAIEFGIVSDQVNAIRGIFSGRHLQVFTSGSEWMVTGDPLTPATVQIRRQTRVGSMSSRYIAPIDVDGATLFVARNGQELREFIYTNIEEAYQASDLALLSHHIIATPIDQDFDQKRRLLFLVRADGKFATLTVYRAESVAAWTLHETAGAVKSVAVVGDAVYFLVLRGENYCIEEIDDTLFVDAGLFGTSPIATATWSGLNHLNGTDIAIVADGKVGNRQTVIGGTLTLPEPVTTIQAGIPFTHIIEPLPPANISEIGYSRAVRLVEARFRIKDTAAITIDVGRGLSDIALRDLGENMLDAPPPLVSGDIKISAYGWKNDTSKPLWRIEQDTPLPFALLSVQTSIIAN